MSASPRSSGSFTGKSALFVAVAASIVACWIAAAPAKAAVTCTLSEFNQPSISITGQEHGFVRVGPGGSIQFASSPGAYSSCGAATVSTIDTITVLGVAGSSQGVVIDLSGGPFAPGFGFEPDTSDEIEFSINLRGGLSKVPEQVWIAGGAAPDDLRVSGGGINLNAGEPAPDIDVFLVDPKPGTIRLFGGGGTDRLAASASTRTRSENDSPDGPPTPAYLLSLDGNSEADTLIGSSRTNTNDSCASAIITEPPPFLGRPFTAGSFTSYARARRDECLIGGSGPDVLQGSGVIGSDGPDKFRGGSGRDRILARQGGDNADGQGGNDRLQGFSGRDRLDGGPGTDTCSGGTGRDRLRDCE